jgi:primase-polymerase (primpol)-like protein
VENTQTAISPNVTNHVTNCLEQEFWLTPQIVVWKFDNDKKIPDCADEFLARPNRKVNWLQPAFWRPFTRAKVYFTNHRSSYNGLGIVLPYPYLQKRGFTCVDLDWKHLPGPTPLQLHIIVAFVGKTYIEYSPSGKGVHLWFRGTIGNCRRGKEVEIYSHSRFMTITLEPYRDESGNIIGNLPFADVQLLAELFAWLNAGKPSHLANMPTLVDENFDNEWVKYPPDPLTQQDIDLCNMAARAKNGNGQLFIDLYNGDWKKYPQYKSKDSQNEPDLALFNIVACYTDDKAQVIRIFHSSQLGKRAKAFRPNYLLRTVNLSFDKKLPHIQLQPISGFPLGGAK